MQDINKNLLRMILSVLVSAQIQPASVQGPQSTSGTLARTSAVMTPKVSSPGAPFSTDLPVATNTAEAKPAAALSRQESFWNGYTEHRRQKLLRIQWQVEQKEMGVLAVSYLNLEFPKSYPDNKETAVYTPSETVCLRNGSVPIVNLSSNNTVVAQQAKAGKTETPQGLQSATSAPATKGIPQAWRDWKPELEGDKKQSPLFNSLNLEYHPQHPCKEVYTPDELVCVSPNASSVPKEVFGNDAPRFTWIHVYVPSERKTVDTPNVPSQAVSSSSGAAVSSTAVATTQNPVAGTPATSAPATKGIPQAWRDWKPEPEGDKKQSPLFNSLNLSLTSSQDAVYPESSSLDRPTLDPVAPSVIIPPAVPYQQPASSSSSTDVAPVTTLSVIEGEGALAEAMAATPIKSTAVDTPKKTYSEMYSGVLAKAPNANKKGNFRRSTNSEIHWNTVIGNGPAADLGLPYPDLKNIIDQLDKEQASTNS